MSVKMKSSMGPDDDVKERPCRLGQDDDEAEGPDAVVPPGRLVREEPDQDPAPVQGRNRDEVEDNEVGVDQDAVEEDQSQAFEGIEAARETCS